MNSPLLKKIASGVLGVLILFYVGYQIYSVRATKLQTETAVYATVSNTIQAQGVAVRQETPVTGQVNGVIDYVVENGGKVSKGGKIAQIFADSQTAVNQKKLQSINGEIAQLQTLSAPGDTYAASPDTINGQINLRLTDLLGNVNEGKFSDLSESRDQFLYLVNERQIVTDKAANFETRIHALTAQRDALLKGNTQPTGSIAAPASGYFTNQADGFESAFDYSAIESITPSQLQSALNAQSAVPAGTLGKICSNFNWYYVFTIPENQFAQIRLGDTVSIQFPFASSKAVPATILSLNKSGKEAAVVLKSNYMDSSIVSIRKETAQVVTDKYEGIRISQKAVHFENIKKVTKDAKGNSVTQEKNVKGVYVMQGNQVVFRQIVPLFGTENYVVCDPNPSKDDLMTSATIQLSDVVVVEGSDLYDGKVVG